MTSNPVPAHEAPRVVRRAAEARGAAGVRKSSRSDWGAGSKWQPAAECLETRRLSERQERRLVSSAEVYLGQIMFGLTAVPGTAEPRGGEGGRQICFPSLAFIAAN